RRGAWGPGVGCGCAVAPLRRQVCRTGAVGDERSGMARGIDGLACGGAWGRGIGRGQTRCCAAESDQADKYGGTSPPSSMWFRMVLVHQSSAPYVGHELTTDDARSRQLAMPIAYLAPRQAFVLLSSEIQ